MPLRVIRLTPDLFEAWSRLFGACASSCFCRYWHFDGPKNDWLARLAFSPETNEAEQQAALAAGHPSAQGLVAVEGDAVIGWLKLSPRAAVPKLRRLPVYRALDLGDDAGVLSVACLLVDPAHRMRGVARALVNEALAVARASGATAVEAYPHWRSEALREEELWMGPVGLFEELGFAAGQEGGNAAYPVLRWTCARDVA